MERGISLNSARTLLDHLDGDGVDVFPVYFDTTRRAYVISSSALYSNTPSDFDFKLKHTARPLNKSELVKELKRADIVFPAMHGPFGEDGRIQKFLEDNRIPYVGTSSRACKLAFDKYRANEFISEQGFFAPPSLDVSIYSKNKLARIKKFFRVNDIKRAVVKPAKGGSSIGVFSVTTPKQARDKAELLFSKRMDSRVVIEPFAEGIEFTSIIVENRFSLPVCILPTEIETDYTKNQIFDFRRKYLPTNQVVHHCPPRFSDETIERIQAQAEQLFSLLGFRDFARFDGWVFPDGRIWFSDFNPVSGMEQNSFLFQQSSRVGFSHRDFLEYILKNSCRRQGVDFSAIERSKGKRTGAKKAKKRVNVLFGGRTSERQVSLMSGTNAWLKLKNSDKYEPYPYLLDIKGRVWELPYAYTLNHTVEEIAENCENAGKANRRLLSLERKVLDKLGLFENERSEEVLIPREMSLQKFIENSPFVFLGLHGGDGEDGTLQKKMEDKGIYFNGFGSSTSRLFMDKWRTGNFIRSLGVEGLDSSVGERVKVSDIEKARQNGELSSLWRDICRRLGGRTLLVKPRADGCSTGIVRISSHKDLDRYMGYIKEGAEAIPPGEFSGQSDRVHMPSGKMDDLLFENFVETDVVRIKGNKLKHFRKKGWIEITIGVLGEKGEVSVFNPSLAVAEGAVLTVEEKFQGGTGVNITPPPEEIVKPEAVKKTREVVGHLAEKMGVKGYARIDAFMHIDSGRVKVIEVNTLPALTPSTVLYHQALAESDPIYPTKLLERIVENSGY